MIYHNVLQNSEEWDALRMGKFTTSCFGDLFSDRSTLKYKKAIYRPVYERISKMKPESYTNFWLDRGHELEAEAALQYELETFTKLETVGFYELDEWTGSSPDRKIVGENAGVEIKCVAFNTQMDYLIADKLPSDYRWQVHGQMFVTGWDYINFVSYCPGLPLFIKRVERDETKLRDIDKAIKDAITSAKIILETLTVKS